MIVNQDIDPLPRKVSDHIKEPSENGVLGHVVVANPTNAICVGRGNL